MSIDEVINYYGSMYKVCFELGLAIQNGTHWKRRGYIPYKQQLRLERLTKGQLVCDEEDPYDRAKQLRGEL